VLPASTPSRNLVLAVNAALSLRRPLLLTGLPGSGKTTLAYVVADWLGLGPVLEWSVTPGATLAEALATYNPLARLQDLEMARQRRPPEANAPAGEASEPPPVEHYMRLGPVGTAFLPMHLPRVLLIDEIDKGDLNLANELLHLFEEGKFPLAELQRGEAATGGTAASDSQERWIKTADEDENGLPIPVPIRGGVVQCHEFPLVVMTSNGEREFPPAFNRRCLRVPMPDFSHDPASLEAIVRSHWGRVELAQLEIALADFAAANDDAKNQGDSLALDQLLNLAYLLEKEPGDVSAETRTELRSVLLQALNREPDPPQESGPGARLL
jgi:MoxR-like ATPase